MRDLFGAADRALSQFGSFYELPPIVPHEWAVGIPARLKLDRCTLDEDALVQLIDRSEGHPRATMLIAQQAHYVATLEPTRRIDLAHVGAGAVRALAADRLKHEQTLAHVRTLGRHVQRLAERVALGTRSANAGDQLALAPAHYTRAVRESRPDRNVAVPRHESRDERQQGAQIRREVHIHVAQDVGVAVRPGRAQRVTPGLDR